MVPNAPNTVGNNPSSANQRRRKAETNSTATAMMAIPAVRFVSSRITVALSRAERCAPVTATRTTPFGKRPSTSRAAPSTAEMRGWLRVNSDERNAGTALISTWQPSVLVMRPATSCASPTPAWSARHRVATTSLKPTGSRWTTSLTISPWGWLMDFFIHASRFSISESWSFDSSAASSFELSSVGNSVCHCSNTCWRSAASKRSRMSVNSFTSRNSAASASAASASSAALVVRVCTSTNRRSACRMCFRASTYPATAGSDMGSMSV